MRVSAGWVVDRSRRRLQQTSMHCLLMLPNSMVWTRTHAHTKQTNKQTQRFRYGPTSFLCRCCPISSLYSSSFQSASVEEEQEPPPCRLDANVYMERLKEQRGVEVSVCVCVCVCVGGGETDRQRETEREGEVFGTSSNLRIRMLHWKVFESITGCYCCWWSVCAVCCVFLLRLSADSYSFKWK